MQKSGNGLSIAGLVLGIVAIVFAWFYVINLVALICGIVGIICAAMGRHRAIMAGMPSGLGTAGLVLSIIGTVLAGIGFFSCTVCIWCAAGSVSNSFNNSFSNMGF